ncbi:hypothetical protein D3C75_1013840 [compost metagenome]
MSIDVRNPFIEIVEHQITRQIGITHICWEVRNNILGTVMQLIKVLHVLKVDCIFGQMFVEFLTTISHHSNCSIVRRTATCTRATLRIRNSPAPFNRRRQYVASKLGLVLRSRTICSAEDKKINYTKASIAAHFGPCQTRNLLGILARPCRSTT